jgi:outer membrane protein
MRFLVHTTLLFAFASGFATAQGPLAVVNDRTPQILPSGGTFFGRLTGPYKAPGVSPVNMQNSPRIFELMRGGQLYLSLADAIAITLENNLDIELERFLPRMADTDLLRAQGGGLLRGVSLLVNQTAPGIGGPSGPLLTNLTAGSTPTPLINTNFSDIALITQQQNNLSVNGPTPLSPGPAIPQYDPAITGLLNWQHLSTPEFTNLFTGNNFLSQNNLNANAGLNVGFSAGTQLSLTFDNSRYTSNSTRYTYNPFITSTLGFTITQPLLQGFGASLNRRFIRIARNSQKVAGLVFQQQVIDTVAGIARLYADLVSLNEDVNVKQESLRRAERLYEDNKNQVEQGTQAPVEVTRANAAVATARQALINAEGLVRQQELIVKTAMTRGGLANQLVLAAHIIPTDTLTVPERELDQSLPDLVGEAIRNRPDLASAGIQVENSEISLKGSLNAVKPQLNLVGSVQDSGLAGNLNPLLNIPFSSLSLGGYGAVLGQIFRRNYPSYGIGLQLNLPLRNRVAQADAARDELEVRQAQVRRQELQDQIRLEVADAEVNLRQARASYEAAVEARRFQEQSVNIELQTFGVGLATNFSVLQYQAFLAQARSTEVASKAAYIKAKIALQRATATILDEHHVSIDEAYRGSVTRPPGALPDPGK